MVSNLWKAIQSLSIKRISQKAFLIPKFVIDTINWPFARFGHMAWNKLHWDANYAVRLAKQGKSGWTGTSSFGLEAPLRNLRPSVI